MKVIKKTLQQKQKLKWQTQDGFTLVEVVIAGVLLASIMTAVAKMGTSSISATKNLATRRSLEQSINNDIQLLQQADSYLTFDSLTTQEQLDACIDPNSFLIDYLEQEVPEERLTAGIDRDMRAGTGLSQDIVEVIYSFSPPEKSVEKEYRMIELNPNFST